MFANLKIYANILLGVAEIVSSCLVKSESEYSKTRRFGAKAARRRYDMITAMEITVISPNEI